MAQNKAEKPTLLGPWGRGIVNSVSDHAIPLDGLYDAVDCDIDREGFTYARNNYVILDDAEAYRDIYEHNGQTYAVSGGFVGIVGEAGFTNIRATPAGVGWSEINGELIYCDMAGVYKIAGTTATQFTARPTIDEEERYELTTIPGGKAVAYWQGRLLVLRGRSLLWSEPLDYGAHSAPRNYVRFRKTPTWMAALDAGLYVGVEGEVFFLEGTDPKQFRMTVVSGANCPGASLVMDSKLMDPELAPAGNVAIWFCDVGFAIGQENGRVVYPQAANLRGLPIVRRKLALVGERLYSFIDEG